MQATPTISVLMAVYHGQEYLREAIDSIRAQTVGDFEFVIIDDGSTDGSLAILREYESTDQRIRIITRPNKGLTKSLNEGIAVCRGEFIARMDSDDVALPDRFEKQLNLLRSNPELIAVGGDVMRIDADGSRLNSPRMPITHDEIEADLLIGKGGALVHPALMIRRSALVEAGGYREKFKTAQDLDLYLRLARKGKLANVPDVVLKYRIHGGSVSHAKREQQDRDVYQILSEAYAARGRSMPRAVGRRRFELTVQKYTSEFWAVWRRQDYGLARKAAWRVIRKAPLRVDSWMLLAHAIVGRFRPSSSNAAAAAATAAVPNDSDN
jgi:glycosyltransferase involved in cell wall biosynthesis